jgi:hypothetical protein
LAISSSGSDVEITKDKELDMHAKLNYDGCDNDPCFRDFNEREAKDIGVDVHQP